MIISWYMILKRNDFLENPYNIKIEPIKSCLKLPKLEMWVKYTEKKAWTCIVSNDSPSCLSNSVNLPLKEPALKRAYNQSVNQTTYQLVTAA